MQPPAYRSQNVPAPTLATTRDSQRLYEWVSKAHRALTAVDQYLAATPAQTADARPLTMPEIRSALQLGGSTPLSIEGLLGRGADPQQSEILVVSSLPPPQLYPKFTELILKAGAAFKRYYRSDELNPHWVELPITAPGNMVTTDTVQNIGPGAAKTIQDILTLTAGLNVTGGNVTVTNLVRTLDLTLDGAFTLLLPNGALFQMIVKTELVTLNVGGLTTDTATNLLTGTTWIFTVMAFVKTSVTGPTTLISIGDAATPARFGSLGTLTAGSALVGFNHLQGSVATDAAGPVQLTDAKVRLTANAIPTGGSIRLVTLAFIAVPPTS
jgi:hypothetical protein